MTERCDLAFHAFQSDGPIQRGLPAHSYTDPQFWKRECETLFSSNWVLAGFAQELPKAGDVMPVDVAGQPIFLIRNKQGEIAAFHNVCSHRCLKLVDAPTNVGRMITCPYHAWAYDLDGNVRSTPYFGGRDKHEAEGFDPAQKGLVAIRSHVWHDWVFVNLDGQAAPFEEYAKPLLARLEGIDLDALIPIGVLDFGVVETNWKFLMENFIEPYHVQFVHKTTTSQPLRDHYTIVDGPCLGSAVDLDDDQSDADSLAVSSRYLTLFPSFVLGRYVPDQLGVYLNVPIAPGKTLQKRAIYMTDGNKPSLDSIEKIKQLWWAVHKEDHAICERMQLGRASAIAQEGGVLSPHWEDSVRAFQELVVNAVTTR